jgi:endogenous inhibitor of DNA gyrase (YacG/DUF329 family)
MEQPAVCPECGKPLFRTATETRGVRTWCTNAKCPRFGVPVEQARKKAHGGKEEEAPH